MPIHVSWFDPEQTIISVMFVDPWTWEDLDLMDVQVTHMMDFVGNKICFLADFSQALHWPKGFPINRIRHALEFQHPNSDYAVLYGLNGLTRLMVKSTLRAIGNIRLYIEIVDDHAAAMEAIQQRIKARNQNSEST